MSDAYPKEGDLFFSKKEGYYALILSSWPPPSTTHKTIISTKMGFEIRWVYFDAYETVPYWELVESYRDGG